jgi:hypothetical protein
MRHNVNGSFFYKNYKNDFEENLLNERFCECLGFFTSKDQLKFMYPEKAIKFCKISAIDLTGTTKDKSTLEILQNFGAFSEYMNFNIKSKCIK